METRHRSQVVAKFSDPMITADGQQRASVEPTELKTLWFNTGTLCNLTCKNCYIESSPKNDSLVYITTEEVTRVLDEAQELDHQLTEVGFTGGEPFLNPQMISILRETLERGVQVLVLTNAMRPMQKLSAALLELLTQFGEQLRIRVSLDHYTEQLHCEERGGRAWQPTIDGLKWLSANRARFSVAGRTMWTETEEQMRVGFAALFAEEEIQLDASDPQDLILFPEMDEQADVPEITTACWNILGKRPSEMMCASSRMVVKKKGRNQLSIQACTLIAHEEEFDLGSTLEQAWKPVALNHPHCSKFCVLGGSKCDS